MESLILILRVFGGVALCLMFVGFIVLMEKFFGDV